MPEERISEILNNIEDHWGSPPILTPDTLTFILNHQWENDKKTAEEDAKKSSCQLLIKEFCKTIQTLDKNQSLPVTNDLMNDSVIQAFIEQPNDSLERQEVVTNHLINLLKQYNN